MNSLQMFCHNVIVIATDYTSLKSDLWGWKENKHELQIELIFILGEEMFM